MNLFDLPERMPCEASCPLLERPGLRIERIRFLGTVLARGLLVRPGGGRVGLSGSGKRSAFL